MAEIVNKIAKFSVEGQSMKLINEESNKNFLANTLGVNVAEVTTSRAVLAWRRFFGIGKSIQQ